MDSKQDTSIASSPGVLHRAAMMGVGLRNSAFSILSLPGDALDLGNWAGKKITGHAMYDGSAGEAMTRGMVRGAQWAHLDAQAVDKTDKFLSAAGNTVGTAASFLVGTGEVRAVALGAKVLESGEVAARAGRLTSLFSRSAENVGNAAKIAVEKTEGFASKTWSWITTKSPHQVFYDANLDRVQKLETFAARGDKESLKFAKQIADHAQIKPFNTKELQALEASRKITPEVKTILDKGASEATRKGIGAEGGGLTSKLAYTKDYAGSLTRHGAEEMAKSIVGTAFKVATLPVRMMATGAYDALHLLNPFRATKGVLKMGFGSAAAWEEDKYLDKGRIDNAVVASAEHKIDKVTGGALAAGAAALKSGKSLVDDGVSTVGTLFNQKSGAEGGLSSMLGGLGKTAEDNPFMARIAMAAVGFMGSKAFSGGTMLSLFVAVMAAIFLPQIFESMAPKGPDSDKPKLASRVPAMAPANG